MKSPLDALTAALADRYRLERELGQGGMATVYLAHDVRHDRRVALKVLRPELAAVIGAERFLAEIKTTANLQHPHILPLFDSGTVDGTVFYAMPYVEGESLRDRLSREKQLPIGDAVRIAREVASALDYAHRHAVIHRDVKPENILLHDGQALVADFGIALAAAKTGRARMTETGMSLGTPHYMSPEQAMGERALDARSDVYALGCVLYEMLVGEPPFTGPTAQAIVAKVMTAEPIRLAELRKTVPPHVEAATLTALAKLPADRFASAHDFAQALANPAFALPRAAGPVAPIGASGGFKRLLYGVAVLAALLLVSTLWGWLRPVPPKPVSRYSLLLDPEPRIGDGSGQVAISPDGSRFVYTRGPDGLFVRSRDQLKAVSLAGTEGAMSPFFSPNGEQMGFFVYPMQTLKVVSLGGGPPVAVTDSLHPTAGATWGRDGFVYGATGLGLARVAVTTPGAIPEQLTVVNRAGGEAYHGRPEVLPNGKGVLFTLRYDQTHQARSAIAVADLATGKYRELVPGVEARYAASGHLLYVMADGTLMVARFDQNAMQITAEATVVSAGIRTSFLGRDVAVSATGTLIYATGGVEGPRELVWVARDGTVQQVDPSWQGEFRTPALSPDGTRLAVAFGSYSTTLDIWIKELDRGPHLKLVSDRVSSVFPTWTPDGRSVTFRSRGSTSLDLWTQAADGSAPAVQQLHDREGPIFEGLWSPDGRWLVYGVGGNIRAIQLGDTGSVAVATTRFTEAAPTFSPDGRWLAYASNESGRSEIYVVPFPGGAAVKRWPVSTGGGTAPTWSRRGGELFYCNEVGNMVAVAVKTTPDFTRGRMTVLFPAAGFVASGPRREYDVSADGQRFLMIRPLGAREPEQLIVVENWFEELRAKARP